MHNKSITFDNNYETLYLFMLNNMMTLYNIMKKN